MSFTVDDHHSVAAEYDTFSGYRGYSSFHGDDVPVNHTTKTTAPEIFRFNNPNMNYSQSPFEPVHVMENGNGHRNS
ncbi:putative clathrin light chain 1-like [Sesbania bispinosa]|nr:putative clathrin light chain 1-like [Sesbania bispinosa]